MSFKHIKFQDSVVMRSLEKVAKKKGLIKEEDFVKNANTSVKKVNLSPGTNLLDNLIRLSEGLREAGLNKYAEEIESKTVAYKQAQTLYETSKEKGEDLVDAAHPNGSYKLEGVDGDAVFETIFDAHLKNMKVVEKTPTGKLASSKEIIDAVKIALGDGFLGDRYKMAQDAPSSDASSPAGAIGDASIGVATTIALTKAIDVIKNWRKGQNVREYNDAMREVEKATARFNDADAKLLQEGMKNPAVARRITEKFPQITDKITLPTPSPAAPAPAAPAPAAPAPSASAAPTPSMRTNERILRDIRKNERIKDRIKKRLYSLTRSERKGEPGIKKLIEIQEKQLEKFEQRAAKLAAERSAQKAAQKAVIEGAGKTALEGAEKALIEGAKSTIKSPGMWARLVGPLGELGVGGTVAAVGSSFITGVAVSSLVTTAIYNNKFYSENLKQAADKLKNELKDVQKIKSWNGKEKELIFNQKLNEALKYAEEAKTFISEPTAKSLDSIKKYADSLQDASTAAYNLAALASNLYEGNKIKPGEYGDNSSWWTDTVGSSPVSRLFGAEAPQLSDVIVTASDFVNIATIAITEAKFAMNQVLELKDKQDKEEQDKKGGIDALEFARLYNNAKLDIEKYRAHLKSKNITNNKVFEFLESAEAKLTYEQKNFDKVPDNQKSFVAKNYINNIQKVIESLNLFKDKWIK